MDITGVALLLGGFGLGMLAISAGLRYRRRSTRAQPDAAGPGLDADIVARLGASGRFAAIRLYRKRTGADLREAAAAVDAIARRHRHLR